MDEEGNFLTVKCDYDFMGRRVFKKVISGNSTVISHHPPPQTLSAIARRACYACLPSQSGNAAEAGCDLTRTAHPYLWLITWDPTQPIATRPLAIQKDGTWYTYGLDLTKNVCEVFGSTGYIATTYTYSPYGSVTTTGSVTQPVQWGSEIKDEYLGFTYYIYRYYNKLDCRWISRDFLSEKSDKNLYIYIRNNPSLSIDIKGLRWVPLGNGKNHYKATSNNDTLESLAYKITGYKEDWSCIWPVNIKLPTDYPTEASTKVKACDIYDVSNLVARNGTRYYAYLDPNRFLIMLHFHKFELADTMNIHFRIREVSGEGTSPISDFFLYGHSDVMLDELHSNIRYDIPFKVSYIKALDKTPDYNRAKNKKGPVRCWFTIGSDARIQGCSTQTLAYEMAQNVMRKGSKSSGTNQTTGLSYKGDTVYMRYNYDYSTKHFREKGSLNNPKVIVRYDGQN